MTVQGIGGALSPALGGWLAQTIGYSPTFLILSGFALLSIALWVVFADSLRSICAQEVVDGRRVLEAVNR
jgi:fucose permease